MLPDRNPAHPRGETGADPTSDPRRSLTAIVALIADAGPGGRLLRRVLPTVLGLIVLSGIGVLAANRLHPIGITAGIGLVAAIDGLILVGAVSWSAWLLHVEHAGLRRTQDEIEIHALHDSLTGLANRGFFIDQLTRRAALAGRRTSMPFAVCSLELDGFGGIIEHLGRAAGDRVLVRAAEVVRDCVRASDLVARLDGDRFGILLEEIADAKDIAILAQRIVSSVPPALVGLVDAPIGVSIGIVMKSSGHDLPIEILREADAALVTAKKRGPGRFELTAFAD